MCLSSLTGSTLRRRRVTHIEGLLYTRKLHRVMTSLWAHSPCASDKVPFFPNWLKPSCKKLCCTGTSICGYLSDTSNCMVRLLGRGEEQVPLKGEISSPWQRKTHSLHLPDLMNLLPGPSWPLSYCSVQMCKLLNAVSRDLDFPS